MIKKFITLFKLGRKIASSDILEIISKFQKPPLAITLLFKLLSISFTAKKKEENQTPFHAITCYLISFLLFFLLHQEGILPPMVFVY